MKPSQFVYHAPTSVDEALETLAAHGDDAKILAGGQSLFPILNFRLAAPEHLIDINRLPDLDRIERTATGWRIPALVRQRKVELNRDIATSVPLLPAALRQVAHAQIRNRGTICGSLAHGDSAAEMPTVMLALDARMSIASATARRTVDASDFFVFHMTTAIEADEMILAVEFDELAPRTFTAFCEFAPRKGDFCLAGAAAVVTLADDGTVARSRIVATGVAPTPLRLEAVDAVLAGSVLDDRALAAAQHAAFDAVGPTGDVHADAAYRRRLAAVMVRRALGETAAASANINGREHHA